MPFYDTPLDDTPSLGTMSYTVARRFSRNPYVSLDFETIHAPDVFVRIECCLCTTSVSFAVPLKGLYKWVTGSFIQDALPELTPAQREMLISRVCGSCWDSSFAEED